jgi:hypothetical protein
VPSFLPLYDFLVFALVNMLQTESTDIHPETSDKSHINQWRQVSQSLCQKFINGSIVLPESRQA